MSRFRLFLSMSTALALAVALGVAPQTGAAAADDEPPHPSLSTASKIFGGVAGGVEYNDLYSGNTPTTLFISNGLDSFPATTFFKNHPYFGPDGAPNTGTEKVRYRWKVACLGDVHPITEWRDVDVPVDPSVNIFNNFPAPTASDTVTLHTSDFGSCGEPGADLPSLTTDLEAYNPNASEGSEDLGVDFTMTPPADLPTFDPETDEAGRLVLYTLGDDDQVKDVEANGTFSEDDPGRVFRYFYANCRAAQIARAAIPNAGGLLKIRLSATGALASASPVIAKKAGASDLKAAGIGKGVGAVGSAASVVADGDSLCG